MKKTIAALTIALALPTLASAGELYGKVLAGNASAGEGVEVSAKCGAKSYPAVKTDKTGSYRMLLTETGKCTMTIRYKQQSASLDVASYEDAVQVDLNIELKDGKLAVRRK